MNDQKSDLTRKFKKFYQKNREGYITQSRLNSTLPPWPVLMLIASIFGVIIIAGAISALFSFPKFFFSALAIVVAGGIIYYLFLKDKRSNKAVNILDSHKESEPHQTNSSTVGPGWYEDPWKEYDLRFFDGKEWTSDGRSV